MLCPVLPKANRSAPADLDPEDIVRLQSVSRQFLTVARDNNLWKGICFDYSRAEALRRRQLFLSQKDARVSELVQRMHTTPLPWQPGVHNPTAPNAEMQAHRAVARRRQTLLANWDPSYPDENANFYKEYIHRHAPITTSWFQNAHHSRREEGLHHEAVGAGILYDDGGTFSDKLVAPLDDGSVCVWDAAAAAGTDGRASHGRIVGKSRIGLLSDTSVSLPVEEQISNSKAVMTETGAVECVSIDSRLKKGYFAVQNVLNEVDLNTLQIVSRTTYPFPITALSEAKHPTPITVGTNWTLHLHDARQQPNFSYARCKLIGGTPPKDDFLRLQTGDFARGHASLSQPGALSILHLPTTREWDGNGDIWVAGRFTSLLNYDRRFFPAIRGSVHSGARLSCLTAIPHPFVGRSSYLSWTDTSPAATREAKAIPGHTMIAAGVYKGKGSLELYGLSPDSERSILSTDSRTLRNPNAYYHNRQTASSSKLLSVAPHGTRYVFSDGDGNLKWAERDGFTPVRHMNINHQTPHALPAEDTAQNGVFDGDIVQKIIPTVNHTSLRGSDAAVPLGQDNLIIWTGDGKLGMLGFGKSPVFSVEDLDEQAQSAQEAEKIRQEREYGQEMRNALERQAQELRWVRGLGMGIHMG